MRVIETRVTGATIQIWLANDPDLRNATEWLEVELQLSSFPLPLAARPLVEIQRSVLGYLRAAIDTELRSLKVTDTHVETRLCTKKRRRMVGDRA